MHKTMDEQVSRIGYKSYQEYLAGAHWTAFRDSVRKKQCDCCGKGSEHLQVHHTTYERLGNELEADVITVCGGCHIVIHKRVKDGFQLEFAHVYLRKSRKEQRKNAWVSWFKLLNKSKHQTVDQLRELMIEMGLSNGRAGSDKAFRMGLVRDVDGKQQWNVRNWINAMKSHRKKKKKVLSP